VAAILVPAHTRPSGASATETIVPFDIRARSTCSQFAVERVIKTTLVEFSGFKNYNGNCAPAFDLWLEQMQAHYQGSVLLRDIPYRCGAVLAIHCARQPTLLAE
jgi:hypothetical protein